MKRAKPLNDLHVLILLTVLTVLVMFIPPLKGTPPRIVLGLLMVLFGVGYSLIAALFPRKDDLDGIERFVLSIALSIAVTSLIGLGLNFSSLGIRLIPVLLSVSSLTIALLIVAGFRRASVNEEDRFGVTPGDIFKHLNHWFTTLNEESISLKLIAAISFSFIIFALYFIKGAPATGYELSIYESTHTLVWVFLIAGFIGGLSIIIHQAFTESKSNYWLIGFFILILTNFVILSLHSLRGYLFYASTDHQSQIREILYIISTGHFLANDLHPALVIYGSQISDICGIRPELVGRYLPPFLSVFFMMVCMYLFAREVLPMKSQILVAAAASFTPFFNSLHVQVYPHAFAVLLFPLILYLYFKIMNRDSWEFRLLFIIFLILLPYSHPSAEVTLIFLFVIMELGRIIYEKRVYGPERRVKIILTPVIISSITFFMWISSFAFFGSTLRSMYSSLFEPYKADAVTETVEVMVRLEWADIIEYVLKIYGDSLIYIIIIGVSGAIIVKRIFKKEEVAKYLFMLFLFCLMSIFVEYLLGVGVQFVKIGRLLNLLYMLTVAPIFVGFLLCELSRNRTRKAIIALGLILALTAGVSTFTVYHSPWIFSPSWHITNMDVKGADWFLDHRNSTFKFDAMGVDPFLMLGPVGLIPPHFNYTHHSTLGESLAHDSYAAINKRCKVANADPMMTKARLSMRSGWGFNVEDFDKLESDQSVAKLYSNGEFDVFFIKSDTREVPER